MPEGPGVDLVQAPHREAQGSRLSCMAGDDAISHVTGRLELGHVKALPRLDQPHVAAHLHTKGRDSSFPVPSAVLQYHFSLFNTALRPPHA
jgi:hypothetical protein